MKLVNYWGFVGDDLQISLALFTVIFFRFVEEVLINQYLAAVLIKRLIRKTYMESRRKDVDW
jgi:hypothetical protein